MERAKEDNETVVAFASQVPCSPAFSKLFERTMALVEDTAAYLDGKGRKESRNLRVSLRHIYESQSLRLTTRLMNLASWALTMRAVREKELSMSEFCRDVRRNGVIACVFKAPPPSQIEGLPLDLIRLMERAEEITNRVRHMHNIVFGGEESEPQARIDPVGLMQQDLLAKLNPEITQ